MFEGIDRQGDFGGSFWLNGFGSWEIFWRLSGSLSQCQISRGEILWTAASLAGLGTSTWGAASEVNFATNRNGTSGSFFYFGH